MQFLSRIRLVALIAAMILALAPFCSALAASASDGEIEFKGVIESLPAGTLIGDWTVGARTVRVTSATQIRQQHGPVQVGVLVEVKGTAGAGNVVHATRIKVEDDDDFDDEIEFKGTVESLPAGGFIGDWVVSGRTVRVTQSTVIDERGRKITVGGFVEVKGVPLAGGVVGATRIHFEDDIDDINNEVEFKAFVESLPSGGLIGDWIVGGRVVHVTAATIIDESSGRLAVGSFVEVKGRQAAGGSVDAIRIHVEDGPGGGAAGGLQLKGTIQFLPLGGFVGDWIVGGITVHVTISTVIEQKLGPAIIGAFVEVKGTPRVDGSFDATRIEVKSNLAGGDGRFEIKGTIQQLPAGGFVGTWIVAGATVTVTNETIINQEHGPVAVGASVEVEGTFGSGGVLLAVRVEVKTSFGSSGSGSSGSQAKIVAQIESMPAAGFVGNWIIGGQVVRVSASTRIKQQHGTVAVGVRVKVKGTRQADGSIAAKKIQVKDSN